MRASHPAPTPSTGYELVYDAFISYSHAKDRAIAAALQSTVQKLGKPWYRRRALRLFRDDTSLSATPQLWPSIEQALSRSRFLILLASPEAAASPWVDKEIAHWLERKSASAVLIALTGGSLDWDGQARDFRRCPATPLPPALKGRFGSEPRWIDLRLYREGASLSDARFTELGADFAAALHGVPKEDLLSQEVRQQRRALRLAVSAASSLAILLAVASWLWTVAEHQKREISAQRDRAEHALGSATDAVLDIAQLFRHVAATPATVVQIVTKIRGLQAALSADTDAGPEKRFREATVLDEIAETFLTLGDEEDGTATASEARALFQELSAAAPDNLDYQHALEVADRQLGKAQFVSSDLTNALDTYNQALGISEKLAAKEPRNVQWQRDVLLCYGGIALVYVDRNDLPAALDAYEHARGVALHLKELSAETADSDLSWADGALAEIHRQMAEAAPPEK